MKRPDPARAVERVWYGKNRTSDFLLPLSWLFGVAVRARAWLWRSGWLRARRLPVPVIVVGNLTVGGTGKTPVAEWVATECAARGWKPGFVSRGYGGTNRGPHVVADGDDAASVGDEPLLLKRRTGFPVCVGADRVEAAEMLIAEGVDLIVADDGLQHHRLARDVEIVVVDGERRFGNGRLLPAGPLREPLGRLGTVDLVLCNGSIPEAGEIGFRTRISALIAPGEDEMTPLESLRGQTVLAIAGVGNPARFHRELAAAGMIVRPVDVPDHGTVDIEALCRESGLPIVMTEKDAVKYRPVSHCTLWVARLQIEMPDAARSKIMDRLEELGRGR